MEDAQFNFYDKLNRAITPSAERIEPEIWFKELRILDTLSLEDERRRLTFHRGFNILWAAPEDPETEQGLYRDGLAGHASGKTLFCRILRHLLGEDPFGTDTQRDNISKKFLNLWALALIRLQGTSWVVGRPLATDGKSFAVEADTIEAAFTEEAPTGGYSKFTTALRKLGASLDPMYPEQGWRHMLPWLARDQEARFSNLVSWRESSSQGDNPLTKVIDRHSIIRAILGLLDHNEPELRKKLDKELTDLEAAEANYKKDETALSGQIELADKQTKALLGDDVPENTEELQERLKSLSEVLEEAVKNLEDQPTPKPVAEAQAILDKANSDLTRAETEQKSLEKRLPELKERRDKDLTNIRKFKISNIEDPTREDNGFCPHSIETAERRGCILTGKTSEESADFIAELEMQAEEDEQKIKSCEELTTELAKQIPLLEKAVQDAKMSLQKAQREANKDIVALNQKAARAKSTSELYTTIKENRKKLEDALESISGTQSSIEETRTSIAGLRKEMDSKVRDFSHVFADIVRAVMGSSVKASVAVTADGIAPHVTRNGELSGAALDTIKTLAFDLASVVASIEGNGNHPRLLIHDGPREGDMARIIYERFFIYAASIEKSFSEEGNISFQYFITTTTPPPKSMG